MHGISGVFLVIFIATMLAGAYRCFERRGERAEARREARAKPHPDTTCDPLTASERGHLALIEVYYHRTPADAPEREML